MLQQVAEGHQAAATAVGPAGRAHAVAPRSSSSGSSTNNTLNPAAVIMPET
jgi:hypothetical protein